MITPSKRLQSLPEGVFQDLALAKGQRLAAGEDVIDLSVGSPDFPPPAHAIAELTKHAAETNQYGYAITALPAFQEAVAAFYERYGVTLDPVHEVLQLAGSQEGLSHLALTFINPGDLVLIPDPGYPIYEAGVRLAGGEVMPIPVDPNTLHPRLDDLSRRDLERAKMMILNYPSNPTAGLATREMFEHVVRLAHQHDIFIVHDFAYSELVFDGNEAISILSIPGAKDVAIEFNSLSKTYNLAGARIAYAVGNPTALDCLRKLKSHMDFGVFLPIQRAAIAALREPWDGYERQRIAYMERRDAFCGALVETGWEVRKPAATMFVWAKTPNGEDSYPFALNLLRATGIAVTPGIAFGPRGEGYVRMAFVRDVDVLQEAARRIGAWLKRH
ncbi:aminotransferase [Alicyclobacillus hesperidum subsp. aegles]|uniref:aminotransferase class I/II-fold pyridoxal phosphate-dependent enzyme n=1 Tax=Alicyclobacillus hesperidum TaxID=89784 RepID=UPI00222A11FB|nr:aminotransferase class I/II-fold pyridoxal phosphate-dependent enzyme [Alicyclobacillus hesperidum]GLG00184.1 aminotransferase [Alicyclobacillus hesperidum subsp. aegles]